MARNAAERNIAFDDVKQKYYVNLDYGKDETGKRNKNPYYRGDLYTSI